MKRLLPIAAAAVVLVTNTWVLVDVARNRAGAVREAIELTERELPLANLDKENTAVMLRFAWRSEPSFDCTVPDSRVMRHGWEATEAFAVLGPRDGPPAQGPRPEWERSRLVVVEAGVDHSALRRRYPDAARFLISRALVRRSRPEDKCSVTQLLPSEVYVPLPHSRVLDALRVAPSGNYLAKGEPRYAVTLRYGSLHHPWVERVRLLK